jgi:MoxR-like ATPase
LTGHGHAAHVLSAGNDVEATSATIGIGMELSREEVLRGLAEVGYVAEPQLAMAITLMRRLQRPLLLEGEAGVGKTEVGKALARMLKRPLIRLQCYEGLDANAAVYEWNYQRQLLAIKIRESEELSAEAKESHVFQRDFLLERPLLKAIQAPEPAVLLIDEIDRADEEFEAYLLEVLSDFQISIPELGTITAASIPWVVLTSNRTRELSDALRRRCLYHYVDYPSEDKELRIVLARVPGIEARLAAQVVRFVQAVRKEELRKTPGVAETLDFAAALLGLGVRDLSAEPEVVLDSLLCLLKTHEDQQALAREVVQRVLGKVA